MTPNGHSCSVRHSALDTASLSEMQINISSRDRLAGLSLHRADMIRRPSLPSIARPAMSAAIGGLQKPDIEQIRCLVAAAPTRVLQRLAMRWTCSNALNLMQDAVIALEHAAMTVPEDAAIAPSPGWLNERKTQRRDRYGKGIVEPPQVNQPELRHDALVRIDVRAQQACHHVPGQRVCVNTAPLSHNIRSRKG